MTVVVHETDEDGFAIIEALVAFAILALSTIALLQAFASATVVLRRAERAQQDMDVAQNVVASALARPSPSGVSTGRESGVDWTLSIEPLTGGAAGPRRISVTVGREQRLRVETIDFGPRR